MGGSENENANAVEGLIRVPDTLFAEDETLYVAPTESDDGEERRLLTKEGR